MYIFCMLRKSENRRYKNNNENTKTYVKIPDGKKITGGGEIYCIKDEYREEFRTATIIKQGFENKL